MHSSLGPIIMNLQFGCPLECNFLCMSFISLVSLQHTCTHALATGRQHARTLPSTDSAAEREPVCVLGLLCFVVPSLSRHRER